MTDYHQATAQAGKIQEDAQTRPAKIAADAETRIAALHERADKEASAFQDAAHATIRAMLRLGEPRATVASLTMLTTGQVRAIERAQPSAIPTRQRTTQPRDHDTPPPERRREQL